MMLPMIYMALVDDDDQPQFEELYKNTDKKHIMLLLIYSTMNLLPRSVYPKHFWRLRGISKKLTN